MVTKSEMRARIVLACRIAILAGVVLFVSACGIVYEWEEEVKLHDGRVIVVKRLHSKERAIGNLHSRYEFKEARIKFREPAAIEWQGDIPPIAVDVVQSDICVVIKLDGGGQCERYGHPNPPFVYFRSQAGAPWRRVDRSDVPSGMRQNLLIYPRDSDLKDLHGVLMIGMKEKMNVGVSHELRDFSPKNTRRQTLC